MIREGAAVVHVRVPAENTKPGWFAAHGHTVHAGDVPAEHIRSIYEVPDR